VNYTVYNTFDYGDDSVVASGYSGHQESVSFQRFPACYYSVLHRNNVDLEPLHISGTDSSLALTWLVIDDSPHSNCLRDNFLDRFALIAVYYAATTIDPARVATAKNSSSWKQSVSAYDTSPGIVLSEQFQLMTKGDQCWWENIICSDDGWVESLSLRSMGLQGTISTSIGLLRNSKEMIFGEYSTCGMKIRTLDSLG
jgi:hypothetical protein